jgi:hypothetical protein
MVTHGLFVPHQLQEQVDLLKYHNERLTKRIEAVQDKDNVRR